MNFAILELFVREKKKPMRKCFWNNSLSWKCCGAFFAFHCMGILLQAHFVVKHEVLQCRLPYEFFNGSI